MSDETVPLSIDPADDDSFAGVLRSVMGKFLQNVDDMLPCEVIAVQADRQRVTVRPIVMMGTTDGQKVSRAQVASVPVLNIGAGGFLLSFPVKQGDLGWLKASDRDISLVMQGLKEEWPNTTRMHSFQDGLFIPHHMRQWTLSGEDTDAMVLQSTDGTTRVAIGAGLIKLTATAVEIESSTLTHNGVNVGDDHTHSGVDTGPGNTGPPT